MTDTPRCGARTRNGGTCHNAPANGTGRCRMHGGAAPQTIAAAERRQAEAEAHRQVALFGARRDIHPAEALIELVQWTAGEVDYWRQRVRGLQEADLTWGMTKSKDGGDDRGDTYEAKPNIAYVMLENASNRLAAYASAALKAGVEERRVRLAEQQGALVAEVIRGILTDLQLSPDQEALVATVVPNRLRLLAGGAA